MTPSIAIINSHSALDSSHAKDSLDLALILGSYEQAPSLFFIGEGVWQLVEQDIALTGNKDFLKTLKAIEFYDIEDVYVCQQSLEERQLKAEFALDDVQVLSAQEMADKLSHFTTVLKF